ncbi:MAG: aminotransferase class I/II-fold pyridoxal phosphate-dependent enzyme [Microthrixaceae bacterium]
MGANLVAETECAAGGKAQTLVEQVEWYVLARLAQQRSASFAGSVPLVIVDAFANWSVVALREVFDRLDRMADVIQIVYLTEADDVALWAEALGPDKARLIDTRGSPETTPTGAGGATVRLGTHGVPAYQLASAVRLHDHRLLEDRSARDGRDIVDLGFGNPDLASPPVAVDKLIEAARNSRNHRYSSSRGLPKLREAVAGYYRRRFGVELDPDREVINTIGAKEGFSHLMWALVGPGDAALVPSPSYPIHIYGPLLAGAEVREIPMIGGAEPFFDALVDGWRYNQPKPRVIVLSFPHNPTTACVDPAFFQRVVDFARENDVVIVHDNAYADLGFDGYQPPSILQADGAKECAVELYSMTKSFSMAGWRVAFMLGNADIVAALAKLKSYLDYGTFQPIQIAATVAINEAPTFPAEQNAIYQARRDSLCEGLNRIGWEITPPQGTMFAWAPIPEPYREMGSIEFAKLLVTDAQVAVSPGVGFGPDGDGFVRFALIENEQRIGQAVRNLRRSLTKLG